MIGLLRLRFPAPPYIESCSTLHNSPIVHSVLQAFAKETDMNRRQFLFTTAVSTIAVFHASPGRANPANAILLLAETGCTFYTIYNTLNDNTSGETLLSAIDSFRRHIKDAGDIESSIAQFNQPKE